MQGIQPQSLTNEEFLRQAYIQGDEVLAKSDWMAELLLRFERLLMENYELTAQVEERYEA
jgi:hypothetical protein